MTTGTMSFRHGAHALVLTLAACSSPVEGSGGGATEANTETATSTPTADTMSTGGESTSSSASATESDTADDATSGGSGGGQSSTSTGNAPPFCGNGIVADGPILATSSSS
jgi:hypothetical protein